MDNDFKPPKRVTVIRHRNSPMTAKTHEGDKVKKEEKLFIEELGKFVKCMDYHQEHFIYLDPRFRSGAVGRYFAWCTCGSPAVLTGHTSTLEEDYKFISCSFHIQYGRHQTSGGQSWQ